MGNFLGDVGSWFFGEQQMPGLVNPSVGAILSKIQKQIPKLSAINTGLYAAEAPAYMKTMMGLEDMYDPGQSGLRHSITDKYQGLVDMGGNLPSDVMSMIGMGAGQGNVMSGLGPSLAGRANVARQFGETSMDFIRKNLASAGAWNRSGLQLNQIYAPPAAQGLSPSDVGNLYTGSIANANQINTLKSNIDSNNQITGSKIMDWAAGNVGMLEGGAGGAGPGASSMGATMGPSAETTAFAMPSSMGGGGAAADAAAGGG